MSHPQSRRPIVPGLLLAALAASVSAQPDPQSHRSALPEQPEVLFVRGATIWTSGPEGIIENGDMIVREGRIEEIGTGLTEPRGAVVVEAAGRHVTPGMIDAHSHTAIERGINEGTNIVTAEVTVEDVVDADEPNIYRELAGGLTATNQLHGSANAIGGRNAVIKYRWGQTAPELFFGARPGIKFALGENPKGSNWGQPGQRYPDTRSGVENAIRSAFQDALDYRREWERWERDSAQRPDLIPPRRDLQLDVLLEILDGERLVHAHSYRADEILMLIRVADEFGFTVATFQHVLEGYKVADEMAGHGAGASTFSDWWAYKYEVRDAIPWNGAIMHDRGVVVSFNSDDAELARRMNLEAAKAVRYGGVDPAEALKFVTINPARQLQVDDRIGSLEPGKDADFVVWSGSPLSTASVAEQTWVDGRRYFDLEEDRAMRERIAAEREALIEEIRALEDQGGDEAEEEAEEETPDTPDTDDLTRSRWSDGAQAADAWRAFFATAAKGGDR